MTRFDIALNKTLVCTMCGTTENVKMHRRNTQFYEDDLNYLIACDSCIQQDNEYYQELWDEYYYSRLQENMTKKNQPDKKNPEIIKEQKRISIILGNGIPLSSMGTYEQWIMIGTKHEKEITNWLGIMSGDW